jgi:hypothetical protein
MKLLLYTTLIAFGQCNAATAEEIKVFTCISEWVSVPKYSVDPSGEGETNPKIQTHKIVKEIGIINTGEVPLAKILEPDFSRDRSGDPFFGPGFQYIVRDSSGRHYLIFFEYEPASKAFAGVRFGAGHLNDLGTNGAVFVGHTYEASSHNEVILGQLKQLTKQNKTETR